MIVTIMQPAYLPWLGFFERILLSDIFVLLDNVQLDTSSKTSFTTRNKIRTNDGSLLLSVPICKKGNFGNLFINKLEINHDSNWEKKHWDSIKQFYKKAPFFEDHLPFFESIYGKKFSIFADLAHDITNYLMARLGIEKKVVYASSLDIISSKDELILDICSSLGATKYISGPFGRSYLNKEAFEKKNIDLRFHDYTHPEYRQIFPGFIPYMSIIDLLFNHGTNALEILNTTSNADQLSR